MYAIKNFLESENMELKLSIREAQTDVNTLVDKLSSLNEKFNVLTSLRGKFGKTKCFFRKLRLKS